MRLASLDDGSRDGRLVVVSRCGTKMARATGIARSLQRALDDWHHVEPRLRQLAFALEEGRGAEPFSPNDLVAPLPRAFEWLDGSAYLHHVELVRRARGAEVPDFLRQEPLIYQGGSGVLLGPRAPLELPNPEWGLDFEAEVCVLLLDVPRGADAERVASSIALVLLANDVSYRNLIPGELKKGFGFVISKPATAFSCFAVTPDELGEAYRDGRVHLPIRSFVNGRSLGEPWAGEEMSFSFVDLIRHITTTRSLTAGTILGSGTVSNRDPSRGVACLAELRSKETLESGDPKTPYLQYGDVIRIEMSTPSGWDLFGGIEQVVTKPMQSEQSRVATQSDEVTQEPARTTVGRLGITRLLGAHYYVHDLERSRRFYVDSMDFEEIGKSSDELEREGRQRSLIFRAGNTTLVCSSPHGEGGRAARYLAKHPDGIGTIVFEVEDIHHAFRTLEESGGTPICDVQEYQDDGGKLLTFSITTPFGDTTFRFIQRAGYRGFFPGMELYAEPRGGRNQFQFADIDHITSNFQTMWPCLFWLERTMGFEALWGIEFHTKDVAVTELRDGSGLRSSVMWDPYTSIKFANNEPYRPFFKRSQINIFNEEHRGDGVQHIALGVPDIISTVRGLRERGVRFMPTPHTYYAALPERLQKLGIGQIDEPIETLEELEILVDGAGEHSYLLQIFLQESSGLYQSPEAGPFFYEIIQRKGDCGFGAGNFRALFESIERKQQEQLERTK